MMETLKELQAAWNKEGNWNTQWCNPGDELDEDWLSLGFDEFVEFVQKRVIERCAVVVDKHMSDDLDELFGSSILAKKIRALGVAA